MSENGETSETIALSGPPQSNLKCITDLSCIEQCSELINQYWLGQNGKAYTVLTIWEVLIDSLAVRSGWNLNEALDVFIGILDKIDASKRGAEDWGQQQFEGRHQEEEIEQENRGSTNVEENEDGSKWSRADSELRGWLALFQTS